jgi:hypothetical protein
MSGSGYGAGPWGGVPWGGALSTELIPDIDCDLFLFEHCTSMLNILASPIISTAGDGTQFEPDYPPASCDLGLLSGELGNPAFADGTAYITAIPTAGIDDQFTLEITVTYEELPNDFTDIANHHFAFCVTDTTGPCAAIFVSKTGLGYAGAFHHVAGTLVLDSAFQAIPGTAPGVTFGDQITYRLAVSGVTGSAYLYATKTADIPVTGHQLAAVLPAFDAGDLTFPPPQDRAVISVNGTTALPTRVGVDRWCLSSSLLIANILPIANAGQDQAIRMCSLALLDGTASFDPEGAALLYHWRLIDGPPTSSFVFNGVDGKTFPAAVPTGFTDRYHSDALGAEDAADPIQPGDVLLIEASPRSVLTTGFDPAPGKGFYAQVAVEDIPDGISGGLFKLLRQRGITDPDTVTPSFYPDVPGFYRLDLTVFDGALYSVPAEVVLNVVESFLPRGCIPDASFLYGYGADFWSMVEDSEVFETLWSGMTQVAATELYTLWQHEYSKSLRDIQRTIVRRWLHYDLVLEEPLPEETSIRTIYAGVESAQIDATLGDPAIAGTSFVISSPMWAEDVTVVLTGVVQASELAATLQNELRKTDRRFSTELIPEIGAVPTFYVVRVDAPFPFTIAAGNTCPAFDNADTNGVLSGTGASTGTRTYLVDKSLQGLGLQEDDIVVIGGIGYRIVRVADGELPAADTFPQQRLVLKEDLPIPTPSDWTIGSMVDSEGLDFYNGLISPRDHAYFEIDMEVSDIEPGELTVVEVLGAAEGRPSRLSVDVTSFGHFIADDTVIVRLAKLIRRTYLPVNEDIRDIPELQEHIVIEDDEATLRRNMDYFLEEYRGASAVRFVSGNSPDVWEGAVPPSRLWAEYTYVDNNPTIEANFGIPVDFTLDELEQLPFDLDYLSAVRGLWYAYNYGPIFTSIRIGAQIFLGLPYAEETGTIVELRTDFSPSNGRILIQDAENTAIVRSYIYPVELELEVNPETGERYAVDDTVEQCKV